MSEQPLVLTYLKSVTNYYLRMEELMSHVNNLLSPPSLVTAQTVRDVKKAVKDFNLLYREHPGFKRGVDLGYRSGTFGGR